MSAQHPYTGRSLFDGAPAPAAPATPAQAPAAPPPAPPTEPGVLLLMKSGVRVFVPKPKDAIDGWEYSFVDWIAGLTTVGHSRSGTLHVSGTDSRSRAFIRVEDVSYAEVTSKAEVAVEAPAEVKRVVEEAKAAAAEAKAAAADANAAADEVAGLADEDALAHWTDEQLKDAIEALRHKVATNHFVEGESAIDVNMEIVRLSSLLMNRRAQAQVPSAPVAQEPSAFNVVPPGAAN